MTSFAQTGGNASGGVERPKLVIGIVVDQMRWDYLYRYYNRYTPNGGFKKMLSNGFTCENTYIPYAPTVTAPGHASIYTGTVPAIHGIAGNLWWDDATQDEVYCTSDNTVQSVGSSSVNGKQSPRNLLVTTIGDELRLATNFKSKVIGIAIKDRGGILPAGLSPTAAYWYDNSNGSWISSSYYMEDLPQWVKQFNERKLVDKYYEQGWNTLYPINTYTQSTEDLKPFESQGLGKGFPYDLKRFVGRTYSVIASIPQGNTFTLDMAKAAIEGENLGGDDITDLLAVSLSSPDYIGHGFGPNSIEQEDDFLRLDKDLGEFLSYLDVKVGQGQYTVFLSADHGVAHVPGFFREHHLPTGSFSAQDVLTLMNQQLKEKFRKDGLVTTISNLQVVLNNGLIESSKINREELMDWIVNFLSRQPDVTSAFKLDNVFETSLPVKIKEMYASGYYPPRGGDIQIILKSGFIEAFETVGTTHGTWYSYDSHIPLLWYGWGIRQGKLNRETYMTDIAPTVAALLRIQMPSGTVGKVIPEVIK